MRRFACRNFQISTKLYSKLSYTLCYVSFLIQINMETGTLIKSTNFNIEPYWVVKCDNSNLTGNRNGELPIDPLSFNFHPRPILENRTVKFELVEIGNDDRLKWYARLK